MVWYLKHKFCQKLPAPRHNIVYSAASVVKLCVLILNCIAYN